MDRKVVRGKTVNTNENKKAKKETEDDIHQVPYPHAFFLLCIMRARIKRLRCMVNMTEVVLDKQSGRGLV